MKGHVSTGCSSGVALRIRLSYAGPLECVVSWRLGEYGGLATELLHPPGQYLHCLLMFTVGHDTRIPYRLCRRPSVAPTPVWLPCSSPHAPPQRRSLSTSCTTLRRPEHRLLPAPLGTSVLRALGASYSAPWTQRTVRKHVPLLLGLGRRTMVLSWRRARCLLDPFFLFQPAHGVVFSCLHLLPGLPRLVLLRPPQMGTTFPEFTLPPPPHPPRAPATICPLPFLVRPSPTADNDCPSL